MADEQALTGTFRIGNPEADLIEKLSLQWGGFGGVNVAKNVVRRCLLLVIHGLDDESVEMLDFLSHKWRLSWEDTLKAVGVLVYRESLNPESSVAEEAREIMGGNDPPHHKQKKIESLHRRRGREIIREEHDNLKELDKPSTKRLKEAIARKRKAKK